MFRNGTCLVRRIRQKKRTLLSRLTCVLILCIFYYVYYSIYALTYIRASNNVFVFVTEVLPTNTSDSEAQSTFGEVNSENRENETVFYHFNTIGLRSNSVEEMKQYMDEQLQLFKDVRCEMPKLDPFADEVARYDTTPEKPKCGETNWVKCYFSECRVINAVLKKFTNIICTYKDMIYVTDYDYTMGEPVHVFDEGVYRLWMSDHAKVECSGVHKTASNRTNILRSFWVGVVAGLRYIVYPDPPPRLKKNATNVLMFAFDSTSKNGFIRRMPKSYEYLTKDLQATVLNSYNIVGDGTIAAMLPILTGKNQFELPDTRIGSPGNHTCDEFPLLFYHLRDNGYRTAYFEDTPWLGTFTFRMKGFNRQPADHYLRPFFLEGAKATWSKSLKAHQHHCVGGTLQYKLMMNLTNQFLHLEGKKFIFTFVSDISHEDFNMITLADEDFTKFLKKFKKDGFLKDTMLIVMGDHGPRFIQKIRETHQGRLEERLPLMAIVLPENLKSERPTALPALRQNVDVLTTPYDVHSTLLDVMDLRRYWNDYKIPGVDVRRGISLLEQIPRNRSCGQAGVTPHWCACLSWEHVATSDPLYNISSRTLLDYINFLTEEFREKCAPRTLVAVRWVMKLPPYNMTNNSTESPKDNPKQMQMYQVKITVDPGKSDFEASMTYYIESKTFHIDVRDISRTNLYKNQPYCISQTHPHLNPYCFCHHALFDFTDHVYATLSNAVLIFINRIINLFSI